MIVIYNPTNEILVGWHVGIEYKIEPGKQLKVPDPTANHLLNHLGTRGLMSLEYGDEGDNYKEKVDAALKRNHDFKMKQVRDHNYRNEQRKAQGLVYLPPIPLVKEYANELGINLVEPYAVKVEETSGMKEIKELVTAQQAQITSLMSLVETLLIDKNKSASQEEKEDKKKR